MARKPSAKAMADRGKFKPASNTDYGEPYSAQVIAATAPFNAMLARANQTWGFRLLECVPPAYAARYRSLVESLDVAMQANDVPACVEYATSLCKALPALHKAALDAGHRPDAADIALTEIDGQVYAFVLHGDLSLIRKAHPDWIVYALSDAALALRGSFEDIVQTVAKHFPNARVSNTRREIVEDVIEF